MEPRIGLLAGDAIDSYLQSALDQAFLQGNKSVYADVDRSLWPFAEWSVRAQLDYLAATEGLPPGVSY